MHLILSPLTTFLFGFIILLTLFTISLGSFLYFIIDDKIWDKFKKNLIILSIMYVGSFIFSIVLYILLKFFDKKEYKKSGEEIRSGVQRQIFNTVLTSKLKKINSLEEEVRGLKDDINELRKECRKLKTEENFKPNEIEDINKKFGEDLLLNKEYDSLELETLSPSFIEINGKLTPVKIKDYQEAIKFNIFRSADNENKKKFFVKLSEILQKIEEIMNKEVEIKVLTKEIKDIQSQ